MSLLTWRRWNKQDANTSRKPARKPRRGQPHALRLELELLEDRTMPSTFLVTNTNPFWAVGIAYLSIAYLAIMGAVAVWFVLRTGGQPEVETPATESALAK